MANDDKLYRIKTKDGAHVNKKVNDDGSRAAIQFDENNDLQGPVDLIEVDESEYTKEVYIEVEREKRGIGEAIIEDAVVPAIGNAIEQIVSRAVDAGFNALEYVIFQKALPAAKDGCIRAYGKVKGTYQKKKAEKIALSKQKVEIANNQQKDNTQDIRFHTPEEVNKILNNMKAAAIYIAAGIRELSNTVVTSDGNDPQKEIQLQKELERLSSDEVMGVINFMLEDGNREFLDEASIRLFEEFRRCNFIVNNEAVPISNYLPNTPANLKYFDTEE